LEIQNSRTMGPPSGPNPRPIVLAPKRIIIKIIIFVLSIIWIIIKIIFITQIIIFRNPRKFLTQIIIVFRWIFRIIIKKIKIYSTNNYI